MILDIDIGNTRLKWRILSHEKQFLSGVESGSISEMLFSVHKKIKNTCIERARIAHVLDDLRENQIINFFGKFFQFSVQIAKPQPRCGAVINGYEEPLQLGVDRWLAMLAAFEKKRQPCVVVDCGSATTIDFISSEGLHVGGYIVPGFDMLAYVLAQKTALLPDVVIARGLTLKPGVSTRSAIQQGITAMNVAFILLEIEKFAVDAGCLPAVFLTGGNADVLADYLLAGSCSSAINVAPDLVLDGLAVALP